MKDKIQLFWTVVKSTVKEFNKSPAFTDAASVAYFAIFSIPGLLIILLWIAGLFIDPDIINEQINHQISSSMTQEVADSLEKTIEEAKVSADSWVMKTFGVITLVFGASTLFFKIQQSLNNMWDVEPVPKQAILKVIFDRVTSLGMIVIIGFLMLITMVLSSLLTAAKNFAVELFGSDLYLLIIVGNFFISFAITSIMFGLIFKILPDVKISWKSVTVGAIVTALLFIIGESLLSLYFSKFNPTSSFGAAGSMIILMMWINYTCIILFFGAIFTKEYALVKGYTIRPSEHAKWSIEKYAKEFENRKEKIKILENKTTP